MPGSEIAARIDETWNFLQENVWANLSGQITMLENLRQFYGERHYYVMEVKRRIIELIGGEENSYEEVDQSALELKQEFCQEHLKLCEILSPGLTEYRAYVSFHYAETLLARMSRNFVKRDTETMISIVDHLDSVILIWSDYRLGSIERGKVELAEILKQKVKKFCCCENSVKFINSCDT